MARLIQHKKEAFWFYRFVSIGYDNLINPFFWTIPMREKSLELAQLDRPDLQVLDAGAGTGFTTCGIVEKVNANNVKMLDQSPHQLAKAKQKLAINDCEKFLGDVENLPFATDTFDRYISAGSIEYWPDPQRAIAEAYRVTKPGGIALIIGPLERKNPIARWLSDTWMLFPSEDAYISWYELAGFTQIRKVYVAPDWYADENSPYAIAIAGVKPSPGKSPAILSDAIEQAAEPMTLERFLLFWFRFVIGSATGALFIPIAAVRSLIAKFNPPQQDSQSK
ncbi:methyltransferase domain-containing protein [Microcoleus sp. A003_D6]|uniref:methyltransferase domain-containing protein n=1 Tax=Microcoleus sp. A003_D6 TaxID=3055266 RepID=UPI002FD133BF